MKKLKYLMLALFVSFAFVLSACGEGQLGVEAQANIGNPETYTEASAEEITAFESMVNDEEATNVSTYRMTMTMSVPEENISMNFNCIYSFTETTYEMALKMYATMGSESQEIKMYIKDEYVYLDLVNVDDETKDMYGATKVKLPMEMSGMEYVLQTLQSLDLSQVLAMTQDMLLETEGVTIKVNVDGTTKRFEVTNETEKIYLVFENDVLTAVQAETTVAEMGSMAAKVVIEKFDGTIEYPNLNSFKDLSSLVA